MISLIISRIFWLKNGQISLINIARQSDLIVMQEVKLKGLEESM